MWKEITLFATFSSCLSNALMHCQYHDLRCESLGKYEGKHPLYRLMREWYAYESIQKNSKRHRLEQFHLRILFE